MRSIVIFKCNIIRPGIEMLLIFSMIACLFALIVSGPDAVDLPLAICDYLQFLNSQWIVLAGCAWVNSFKIAEKGIIKVYCL